MTVCVALGQEGYGKRKKETRKNASRTVDMYMSPEVLHCDLSVCLRVLGWFIKSCSIWLYDVTC